MSSNTSLTCLGCNKLFTLHRNLKSHLSQSRDPLCCAAYKDFRKSNSETLQPTAGQDIIPFVGNAFGSAEDYMEDTFGQDSTIPPLTPSMRKTLLVKIQLRLLMSPMGIFCGMKFQKLIRRRMMMRPLRWKQNSRMLGSYLGRVHHLRAHDDCITAKDEQATTNEGEEEDKEVEMH
ncbi:hypothetical protein CPB84DRAFT_1749748 [Gymnopilus junonius]|uniref:Uncharacterized protein n=1 Tax=Gymnopilus junonius TaxID=109634 RepID=A0A9P5NJN2_GYMJU|nr:hypothetical protein CPB84DRAFT_1749748 [Gymnopilus junonius]